jgi:two-component system, cell cycle sensor histidine kinase and response regulator CckA
MPPDVARLAALTIHSSDVVLMLNAAGEIEWAGPGVTPLLGFEEAALEGATGASFVAPEDIEGWHAFLANLLGRPGASLFTRLHCRHHDGSARWVHVTGQNLLAEPSVRALALWLRESTARAGSIDSAPPQSQELRFRTLIEDSLVSIFILQNGRLAYVNRTGALLFGYSVAELLALESVFTLIHEQDRGYVIDQLSGLGQADARTLHLTIRGRRKDDSVVHAETIFAASEYMGQAATLLTVLDVGHRMRLEDQLRQAQKLEAVSRLAGGIAHDFNNLLASIRGNAELIGHQLDAAAPPQLEVAQILGATDRAAGLTRQLLAFSRKQVVQPTMLDLNGVVLSVSRMASRLMGSQVHVEERLAPGLPQVLADPAHLEQVLLNLVVNARDAMPGGGPIRIATDTELLEPSGRAVAETGLPPGLYVRMSVQDEGVGMDAATRARIFEPFFSTREPGRGTGLGLSTVYGILRQTGGAITVTSEPMQGATFVVYLPAVTGASHDS